MDNNYYTPPQVEVIDLELENPIMQYSGEDMTPIDFGW